MGKKRTTMSDVAKAAGVSRTTVSFVLNNTPDSSIAEATRQRILQVAHELDYAPNTQALSLATGKTMMIALVLRKTARQVAGDAFLSELIEGAIQALEPQGYHLMIHTTQPNRPSSTYRDLVRTRKVDGLLISAPMVHDPEIRLLHDEGTPIVLNGATDDPDIPSVDVDNRQGAYVAVQHLVTLGHRRIGHISNAPFSYTAACERLDGYRLALSEAGIDYDEALVRAGNFTDESGYSPMLALLDLNEPPTGVFVGSDTVALGAYMAMRDRGLSVPQDISIIGFDNMPVGKYLQPALTTVHLPASDIGQQAAALLLDVIGEQTPSEVKVSLPTSLIVRSSTAPRAVREPR
jgi:LacI family transcriptional regulator